MSKLSNTGAIKDELRPGHSSRDVRKIDGGHLVRETLYSDKSGESHSSERFVPKGQKVVGQSSLAEAVRVAKGG